MSREDLNVLVLGVGNILLSDEGAGVGIVKRLEEEYYLPSGLEIMDGGTSGLELLPYIEGRTHLFIIDVINSDRLRPGEVEKIDLRNFPAYLQQKITPHQLGLSDVLAIAQMTEKMPEKVYLLGIRPKTIDTGLEISKEVKKGMEVLFKNLLQELAELNLNPVLKRKSSA